MLLANVCLLPKHGNIQQTLLRCFATWRPRRAFMYVPGHSEKMIRKAALEVCPDTVCMDMEDGVATNKKAEARSTIARLLSELDFGQSEVAVRINRAPTANSGVINTGDAEEDLQTILSAPTLPDTLVLPKVEDLEDLKWMHQRVHEIAGGRIHNHKLPPLGLITFCESARALLNLKEVLQWGVQNRSEVLSLEAVVLGGDDLAADLGARRTVRNTEILMARQMLVTHCRAFGLQAIDIVKINLQHDDDLKREAEEGAGWGFQGKQVIHPRQVPIVQEAFTPSTEEVEAARQLVEAFELHQEQGRGAFTWKGQMIDMPSVLQARNVLAVAAAAAE